MSSPLISLYEDGGQSPWLDNLRRDWIEDGQLADLVRRGVRGVTSNPTIFAKAISGSDRYDEQFAEAVATSSAADAYWDLVVTDIVAACDLLAEVHSSSEGTDGFVSVEVAPALAHDGPGTVAAARALHARIDRPNVMIKVPATIEGLSAIETLVGDGISVNVTLIFSVERYDQVIEAYLRGLEHLAAAGGALAPVAGVASFFISRVDSAIDPLLEAHGAAGAALLGQVAVAQAKAAFALAQRRFGEERFAVLAAQGAQRQRPLWASTSTKNPSYPELLYVDTLIGPGTVNTLPDATLLAFEDHGQVSSSLGRDLDAAIEVLGGVAALGIDLEDVAAQLEREGVASFAASFDQLLAELETKAASR